MCPDFDVNFVHSWCKKKAPEKGALGILRNTVLRGFICPIQIGRKGAKSLTFESFRRARGNCPMCRIICRRQLPVTHGFRVLFV